MWLTLLLLAVTAVVYLPSLRNGFVWDDRPRIAENPQLETLAGAWHSATSVDGAAWQPVVFASYALDAALWGRTPAGFHATNLLLHLLNVAGVVWLARRTGAAQPAALLGAAVFALHPVQVEAVAYLSARADLLVMGGALAGTLLLLRRGAPWRHGLLAAAAGAFAMLSRESGYALVVLWPWLAWRHAADRREAFARAVPVVLVAVALFLLRPGGLPEEAAVGLATRLAAFGIAVAVYVQMLLWPAALQIDRLVPLVVGPLAWGIAAGTLVLAALGLRARGTRGDWAAWAVLFYLPVSNLLPFHQALTGRALVVPEHNLYVPLAGLGVLLGLAAAALAARVATVRWRRVLAVPVVAGLAVWALLTATRVRDWHDDERLFMSAVAHDSASPRVWYNAATVLLTYGAYRQAVPVLEGAARRAPQDAEVLTNLAVARQRTGDFPGAADAYARARELRPDDPMLLENIATLEYQRGDKAAAAAMLRRVLEIDPERDRARQMLDVLESGAGETPVPES